MQPAERLDLRRAFRKTEPETSDPPLKRRVRARVLGGSSPIICKTTVARSLQAAHTKALPQQCHYRSSLSKSIQLKAVIAVVKPKCDRKQG